MNRTETYPGPWPRKRHSHRCMHCWNDRMQPAVYCYKRKCAQPQQTDRCECCRALQPSATYRPAAPIADRTNIGNTPSCEDCGQPADHCICDESGVCPVCGCLPCSCEEPCEACGAVECKCEPDVCIAGNPARNGKCGRPDCVCAPNSGRQLNLFGGAL